MLKLPIFINMSNKRIRNIFHLKERFEKEWTGVTLFMGPEPSYKPHKDKKNGLWDFLPFIFKQRSLIANIVFASHFSYFYTWIRVSNYQIILGANIVFASLLVTLINILGSYYLQGILDEYVPNQMKSTLGIISIGLVVTFVLQQMMTFQEIIS